MFVPYERYIRELLYVECGSGEQNFRHLSHLLKDSGRVIERHRCFYLLRCIYLHGMPTAYIKITRPSKSAVYFAIQSWIAQSERHVVP